jgi:hypothetical protein
LYHTNGDNDDEAKEDKVDKYVSRNEKGFNDLEKGFEDYPKTRPDNADERIKKERYQKAC